jgi:hypothetical protein
MRNLINFFAFGFLLFNFIVLNIKIFPGFFIDGLSLIFDQWETLFILIKQADLVSLLAANFLLFIKLIAIYFVFVFLIVQILLMSIIMQINQNKLKLFINWIFLLFVFVEISTIYRTILVYSFTLDYYIIKLVLALLCILSLGLLTFYCKKIYPLIYGCIEILVGILLVYIALKLNIDDSIIFFDILKVLIGILIGIYVIVRGMDNIYQGNDKVNKIIQEIIKEKDTF